LKHIIRLGLAPAGNNLSNSKVTFHCSHIYYPPECTDVGLIKATNEDSLHHKRQVQTSVSWGWVWEEIMFLCLIRLFCECTGFPTAKV